MARLSLKFNDYDSTKLVVAAPGAKLYYETNSLETKKSNYRVDLPVFQLDWINKLGII